MPPLSGNDDLTVAEAVAAAVDEDKGTCKAPSALA
jgi:hypothetical protein